MKMASKRPQIQRVTFRRDALIPKKQYPSHPRIPQIIPNPMKNIPKQRHPVMEVELQIRFQNFLYDENQMSQIHKKLLLLFYIVIKTNCLT